MKDYLTQSEMMVLVTLTAINLEFKDKLWDKIPEHEKEAAQKIIDDFKAYKNLVFERVGDRGKKRLYARVKNYEPMLVPRTSTITSVHLPQEAWFDMVCYVIELKCRNCVGKKRCRLRNILHDMEVPEAVIPDGVNTICEYQYKEQNEMKRHSKIEED